MGKVKDTNRKQKAAKVHELRAQAKAGAWPQQPYAEQHSLPPQRGPQGVTTCHMKMIKVNQTTVVDNMSKGMGPKI